MGKRQRADSGCLPPETPQPQRVALAEVEAKCLRCGGGLEVKKVGNVEEGSVWWTANMKEGALSPTSAFWHKGDDCCKVCRNEVKAFHKAESVKICLNCKKPSTREFRGDLAAHVCAFFDQPTRKYSLVSLKVSFAPN